MHLASSFRGHVFRAEVPLAERLEVELGIPIIAINAPSNEKCLCQNLRLLAYGLPCARQTEGHVTVVPAQRDNKVRL